MVRMTFMSVESVLQRPSSSLYKDGHPPPNNLLFNAAKIERSYYRYWKPYPVA
jgi:hypothetical protein